MAATSSTDPPGPVRIATCGGVSWGLRAAPGSTDPPGPVRIATAGFSGRLARTTARQHRPSGAGEDRNLDRGLELAALDIQAQHRPSGAGEDRNKLGESDASPDRSKQHRPSGAGEDRNTVTRGVNGVQMRHAAPTLRGR